MLKSLALTVLKVAIFAATPFKSLSSFKHYFALSAQINNYDRLDERRVSLRRQLKLLFLAQFYFITLNLFHSLAQSPFPEVHILTLDVIYYLHLPSQLDFLYALQVSMVTYYLYLFYFRPSAYLNGRLAYVLFGRAASHHISNKNYFKILSTYLTRGKGYLLSSLPTSQALILAATTITNLLEGFILVVNLVVLLGVLKMFSWYFERFLPLQLTYTGAGTVFSLPVEEHPLGTLLLTLPLFLGHFFLILNVVYAYTTLLAFMGSYTFVSIVHLYLLLRENSRQMSLVIGSKGRGKKAKTSLQLVEQLYVNISHFRYLFALNSFLGTAFSVFLLTNFPTCAICAMLVLLDGHLRDDLFAFSLMLGIVAYEMIGLIILHVCVARLSSRHLHGSAVLLLRYNADSQCGNSRRQKESYFRSSFKSKLIIWSHTMRLLTVNRYGFTYGLVRAPVTMSTFAKVPIT